MQNILTIGGISIGLIMAARNIAIGWIEKTSFKPRTVNMWFSKFCIIPVSNFKESFIKLNSLNIFDEEQLKVKMMYLTCEKYAFAIIFEFALLILTNNLIQVLLMIPIVFLVVESLMQEYVDKTYLKFLEALDNYCQRLTTSYNRTFNVTKTMEETTCSGILKNYALLMTDMCYNNKQSREELYNIRSFGNAINLQLAEIIRVCANLGLPATSIDKSPFMVNMLRFNTYVQNELHLCEDRQSKFGTNKYILSALALYFAALPIMITNWFTQINHVFNGVDGLLQRIGFVVLFCALFVFSQENSKLLINREMDVSSKNNEFIEKHPKIVSFIVPRNLKKVNKVKMKLLGAASYKTVENHYVDKVYLAVIMPIITLLLIVVGLTLTRRGVYTSTADFNTTGNWGLEEDNKMDFIETDQIFLDMPDKEFQAMSNEDIQAMYEASIPGITALQSERCVQRIKSKVDAYKKTDMPTILPFILMAAMVIGYFIPEIMLRLRKITKDNLRRIDIDAIMNMLVLYSYTTMIVDDVVTELANMTKILSVELVYTREMAAEDKDMYIKRQKYVKEDLATIYDKFYAMETSLTINEAMSNIPGIIDSRRQTINYNIRKNIDQIAGFMAILFMLPMLYITMFILVSPMMTVSLQGFMESMSQLN